MPGTREALLVAASDYEDPELTRLRWPAADVASLAAVLGDAAIGAFEVHEPLVNEPTDTVRRRVDEFLSSAGKQDFRLLYFSCHGILAPGRRLYFAMRDTVTRQVRSTAVEGYFVHEALQESRAGTKVLILDCCHSGAFGRGVAKGADERDIDVGRFEGGGVVTLTASREIEYAYESGQFTELEGATGGSIFTQIMVEGLRTGAADLDKNGVISVDELYEWTEAQMRARTDRQRPGRSTYLHGRVEIGYTRRSRVDPALRASLQDSTSVHGRLYAIDRFRRVLQDDPSPEVVTEIRDLLAEALHDDDAQVAASAEAVLGGREAPATRTPSGAAPAPPSTRAADLIRRADRELLAGSFARALDLYDRALELSPAATSARVGRAHALSGLRRHDEALDALDAAVAEDPEHVWARVSRAELLLVLGRPAAAKLDVDAALAAEADSIDALTTQGRVLALLRRGAEARAAFEHALAIEPDHVAALVGLAEVLGELGEAADAHAALDRAIEIGGASEDARLAKAQLHYRAGELALGDAQVAPVLERDPAEVRALVMRGLAYLWAGTGDPLADFDRALAAVPDLPGALFGRATVLRDSQPAKALKAVRKVARAPLRPGTWQPPPADVKVLEASLQLALRHPEKALEAADAALAEAPGAPAAVLVRARAHIALGLPELAIADLDAAAMPGRAEEAAALRSEALGGLLHRPREVWPDNVSEDHVALAMHGGALLAASLAEVPLDPKLVASKLGPGEELLWLTACRYREEMIRRVALVLTSRQLIWAGRIEGEVSWSDVRDVRALPPKGMRLVLHSGRRLEFPGISDDGVALDDANRHVDATGVRELATELSRGAAAG